VGLPSCCPRTSPRPSLRRTLARRAKLPTELTFEELDEGDIICGGARTVRDELRAGIVCSALNGGSQRTLEMMQRLGGIMPPP
jgi:hypothetical protein